jgi:hypothetical protein
MDVSDLATAHSRTPGTQWKVIRDPAQDVAKRPNAARLLEIEPLRGTPFSGSRITFHCVPGVREWGRVLGAFG